MLFPTQCDVIEPLLSCELWQKFCTFAPRVRQLCDGMNQKNQATQPNEQVSLTGRSAAKPGLAIPPPNESTEMQPSKNSFRLTTPEPSKNSPYGPIFLGTAMVAGGGIFAYLKFDDFIVGKENGSFAGKAIGIAVLGLFILVRATSRLLKGENLIRLQNDHIDAAGQMPQIPYQSILAVRQGTSLASDYLFLTLDKELDDPACAERRKAVRKLGQEVRDCEVVLWVSQSGWVTSELCKQIQERLQTRHDRIAA